MRIQHTTSVGLSFTACSYYTGDMTKNENVLFVVLNYNGWQETLTCIDAVLAQTYSPFHILLIDNGSADESLEKLKKFESHKKITFMKNPKNLGFSGGVNCGIRYALQHNFPYTVLLNNDATISKTWLKKLVETMQKTKASIVTGLLLSSDGKKIESTGDSYSRWGLPFPRQRDETTASALSSGYVFGGTAGASLYKTALFEEIGLFDEIFFAYYEDTDICLRAQIAGHKAYYEKSAIAYHDHGTTSSKLPGFTVMQNFKNLPLFFWKDMPLAMFPYAFFRFYGVIGLTYIRAVLRGQFAPATKGLLLSIWYFPHALKERWRIQESRTVSIDYLRSIMHDGLPPSNRKTVRRVFHL